MPENKKNNNKNKLNDSTSETQAIISRLKAALDVQSDGQLANYLGISRQNIGAARKRNDVPPGWIYKVAALTGCSMDWLRFGHGPQKRVAYATEGSPDNRQIASPHAPYDRSISWQPRSVDQLPHDQDTSGFGAAVEMLAKIYGSGDHLLIRTIHANIQAFCESIDRRQREQRSGKEIQNLKQRLATIEKQLQQTRRD